MKKTLTFLFIGFLLIATVPSLCAFPPIKIPRINSRVVKNLSIKPSLKQPIVLEETHCNLPVYTFPKSLGTTNNLLQSPPFLHTPSNVNFQVQRLIKQQRPSFDLSADLATYWNIRQIPVQQTNIYKLLNTISKNLENARNMCSHLTPTQLMRLNAAENYFYRLTLQQASDISVMTSANFRQHAAFLRAPQATEYAFYIQGYNFDKVYESLFATGFGLEDESGYIATVIGSPKNGVTLEDIHQTFAYASKTDQPLFVQIAMHGNINSSNHFIASANATTRLTAQDIVRELQFLRQVTGTPEVNVLLDSCHGGMFMTDFEQLPLGIRKGINAFVFSGNQQYSYNKKLLFQARSRGTAKSIVLQQLGILLQNIENTNIFVRANIHGKPFNPLQEISRDKTLVPYFQEIYSELFYFQTTTEHFKASDIKELIEKELEYRHTQPVFHMARTMGEKMYGQDFNDMFDDWHFLFR